MDFYSNIDKSKCGWKFVAYYDISELTTNCQAQIISDSDIRDVNAEKSYLTIKIPIFVSYIYPSFQASWSSIEYKSEIDAFIIYKTTSLDETNQFPMHNYEDPESSWMTSGFQNQLSGATSKINHELLFSMVVSKISMNQQGKLVIDFTSIPTFRGQFVKYHSSFKNFGTSSLNGPLYENIDFDLDLIWSQYTYDFPEQTWRATSKSILNVSLFPDSYIFIQITI